MQDSHPQRSEKRERTDEVAQKTSLGEREDTEVVHETQSQIRRKGETQVAQDSHPKRSEKTERTEEVAQGVSLGEESNTEVVQGTHPHAQHREVREQREPKRLRKKSA